MEISTPETSGYNLNDVKTATDNNNLTRIGITRLLFIVVLIYATFLIYTYNTSLYSIISERKGISHLKDSEIKYILLWTKSNVPLSSLDEGNDVFVEGECSFTNCFFTSNKDLINQADFSAVVFGGWDLSVSSLHLPSVRSPKQKYIFVASESSHRFPVCAQVYDGFFNWTWTYRLDSDVLWRYLTIYDLDEHNIGPSLNTKWLTRLAPIDDELKIKLSKKSKAAAWFVSHCITMGQREQYVHRLQKHLKAYGWAVDVYGKCGKFRCPRKDEAICFKKLERDYYFYLSFENSFAEDYVTEKLLNALNNYAVPIVYGAANYSRFLPPGSYLNARKLGPRLLARRMNEIIRNISQYHDFFRWRNHYIYRESNSSDKFCKLCQMINDENKMSQMAQCKDFGTWWNGRRCKSKLQRKIK